MRLLALLMLLATGASAQPYPLGLSSQHQPHGLAFQLDVPKARPGMRPFSMIVVLHGAGGTAIGMAHSLAFMVPEGFVVVAPKSSGRTWSAPDIEQVKKLVRHLVTTLEVDPRHLHAVGFSNGGWNLPSLAFDPSLHFLSATFIAAGWQGRKPPKGARKRMSVLALVGGEGPNLKSALAIPRLLRKHLKWVETRVQPGLGHAWPQKLMPVFKWWVEVMDGRFKPGYDLSLAWLSDGEQARQKMRKERRGGFIYFYSHDPREKKRMRWVQERLFFDRRVRFYGQQLVPLLLDRDQESALLASLKIKQTPALVVLNSRFKPTKVFTGRISASKLAAALRARARKKELPRH